jgi:APA family basic amino acid/polyamine antiporter
MEQKKGGVHEQENLKKQLGLIDAIAIVVGMVIGSGVFFKPTVVFKNAGAPGLGILAWIVGGIITIAAGLTVAEVASAITKTGGLFTYLKELYGEKWGFLLGWVQTLIYYPGSAAALAIVFATQATFFIPMSPLAQKLLAIFMMFLLMIANILSTKFGGKIQTIATIGKLVPIFVITIFGLIMGTAHDFTPVVSDASTAAGFGAAILGTLWAYNGWQDVGNMAGEIDNPGKNLPKSIVIGLALVMVAYLGVNLAVINVLPMESVVASNKPASDAAVAMFGTGGAAFIAAGILVSVFGALNGYILTGPRVSYAMGEDKIIPGSGFFGKLSEKYATPANGLIFQFLLSIVYVLSGTFDTITDLVVFAQWIFNVMVIAGVFILRAKHKDLKVPYRVPLYPVIPVIGIIGGIYILINTLFTNTTNALIGVGITLIGLPVYVYMKKKRDA